MLVPLGVAPWLLGYAGAVYGVVALVGGAVMVALALRLSTARPRAAQSRQQAAVRLLDPLSVRAVCRAPGRARLAGAARPVRRHDDGDVMNDRSRNRASCSPRSRSARRRARSIAIALSLGALVVLFYVVTLVKGPGVLDAAAMMSRR